MAKVEIRGELFELLPDKAIYWLAKKTMLISDLHLGKITHFRKSGIALPAVAAENNFKRLTQLIASRPTERLFVLGDLFHHHHNREWELFSTWRAKHHSLELLVIQGNHDILPRQLFKDLNITLKDFETDNFFLFTHYPVEEPDPVYFNFCGHLHPVFCLRSQIRPSLRLPCYVVDPHQLTLPSFGVFTGGYEINAMPGRKIYVIAEENVIGV